MAISGSLRQQIRERGHFCTQAWNDHLTWTQQGTVIRGISAIGRATVERLDMNDTRYPEGDSIRATRKFWGQIGLHPPEGDRTEDG